MSFTQIRTQIGAAWQQHRAKNSRAAAEGFQQVLSELDRMPDAEEKSHHLVDALYGLGLAERAQGSTPKAAEAFKKALEASKTNLNALRSAENTNNLDTEEDDRFAMLIVMIKQRLSEMGITAN